MYTGLVVNATVELTIKKSRYKTGNGEDCNWDAKTVSTSLLNHLLRSQHSSKIVLKSERAGRAHVKLKTI
jgi:hypothetical protein